ncbi:putative metal-nicotianamine transporter YSL7 [Capsicum chinense]|nr:putative metal-nicotianamine transporter YSL7 [Capsicum chinense]
MVRSGDDDQERVGGDSTEKAFEDEYVPPWQKQITLRAMVTGLILSVVFNFIVCKLNLTTGIIPSLNVAAGLLGFAGVRSWTAVIDKCGMLKQPFTRQENTVIQTCVVASSGIAFSSGTASYMLGMSPYVAAQADAGNTPNNTKKLAISWMLPYLFVVSFAGLFSIVALRKMMILKYKLTYPSGTATAYLINCFHTPKGAKLAKKQVGWLFKSFGCSFIFGAVQWLVKREEECGFDKLPTFGSKAYAKRFYFDFSPTYIGVGMLCPYMVNISLLIGAIISWAIMWPMIEAKEGDWYPANLGSSLHGIQGYRVFIAIATMLGDGLFHFGYMLVVTILSFRKKTSRQKDSSGEEGGEEGDEEKVRNKYFLKDRIPHWAAVGGYCAITVISMIAVPFIFHSLKWYHILVAYLIAPILAFCNSYGSGLTDWSLASNYGKIAILAFSSWVGLENGGVIAGLASCGLMMSIVDSASGLMGDFKTGYLTLASPRSMFVSQLIGTAMGCIITPPIFWIFNSAYKLGDPEGPYPAPYGLVYRGIALLGVEGFGNLPKNCLKLSVWFFFAAVVINLLTQLLKKFETKYRIYRFIPSPMCMAIPFYLGGYFAIDMCLGSLILFGWQTYNKQKAKDFGSALASGLICGNSLWGIPEAVLALAGVKAPFCMKA